MIKVIQFSFTRAKQDHMSSNRRERKNNRGARSRQQHVPFGSARRRDDHQQKFIGIRNSQNHRKIARISSAKTALGLDEAIAQVPGDRQVSALTVLPVLGGLEVVGRPADMAALGYPKSSGRRRREEAEVEGGERGEKRKRRHGAPRDESEADGSPARLSPVALLLLQSRSCFAEKVPDK
jgi:hypothetical protein